MSTEQHGHSEAEGCVPRVSADCSRFRRGRRLRRNVLFGVGWLFATLLVVGLHAAEDVPGENASKTPNAAENQKLYERVIGEFIKSRNQLRSGVFRVDGELDKPEWQIKPSEGKIAIFSAFDFDRKLLRFDRTDPMKQGARIVPWKRKLVRTEDIQIRCEERVGGSTQRAMARMEPYKGERLSTGHVFDARLVGAVSWGALDYDLEWDAYSQSLLQKDGEFERRVTQDDDSLYRVTTVAGKIPTRTIIWFDPAQGFAPVRYESSMRDRKSPNSWGDPIERTQTTWKQMEGVWLPEVCTQEQGGRANGEKSKRTLRFQWLSINKPVEDPLFTIDDLALPEGALLVDRTQGGSVAYRISNGQREKLSGQRNVRLPQP